MLPLMKKSNNNSTEKLLSIAADHGSNVCNLLSRGIEIGLFDSTTVDDKSLLDVSSEQFTMLKTE